MPEDRSGDGGLTVLDYLRPIWRFKYVVVPVVALAMVATYLYTNRQTKVYQTSTDLYVGQSSFQQLLNPTSAAPTVRSIADQAQLLATPKIAEVARAREKLPYAPDVLLGALSVVPNSNSDFLTIVATTTNPDLAAKIANGFAQAYLQVSSGNLVNQARSALHAAQTRLRGLAPGNANATVRQALRQQIATLEGVIVAPPSTGQQLTQAFAPSAPTSPNPEKNTIFAGALAIVLALIVSYLVYRSDSRVRRFDELEGLFELPVLASIPHVRRAEPTREDPYGTPIALREPYRTLRVNLDLARAVRDGKLMMVTSALPAEGKSTVVRNLAISYCEAGARVAVIESDLRRPVLAASFGLDPSPGLGEALVHGGDLHLQRVPHGVDHPNVGEGQIDVLVAGTAAGDPTALLTQGNLRTVLARLIGYDIVLVDTPPLLPVSDALPLLGLVDGVLVAVRAGTATRSAAVRLRRTFERVNRTNQLHLLGVVANDVVDEFASYYYGGDGKGRTGSSVSRTPDPAAS